MDIWPDVKTEGIGRGLEFERVASQSPVGGGLPWLIERGVAFTAGTRWKFHMNGAVCLLMIVGELFNIKK